MFRQCTIHCTSWTCPLRFIGMSSPATYWWTLRARSKSVTLASLGSWLTRWQTVLWEPGLTCPQRGCRAPSTVLLQTSGPLASPCWRWRLAATLFHHQVGFSASYHLLWSVQLHCVKTLRWFIMDECYLMEGKRVHPKTTYSQATQVV